MDKHKNIPLNKQFSISPEFFIRLYMAIEENKGVIKECTYTAKRLCGKDFWSGLTNGERKQAGICISQLVRYELLNFMEVKGVHEYPKYYQLK
jgi:hypothetical protein